MNKLCSVQSCRRIVKYHIRITHTHTHVANVGTNMAVFTVDQ